MKQNNLKLSTVFFAFISAGCQKDEWELKLLLSRNPILFQLLLIVLFVLFVSTTKAQENHNITNTSYIVDSNYEKKLDEFKLDSNVGQNYFIIGWANIGTHFIPNKENYNDIKRDIISPGFELQLSCHFRNRMVLTSGLNYQTLFFCTPLKKNETSSPNQINTALLRDLSIPLLLRFNLFELKESCNLNLTLGFYYSIPLFAQKTVNDKIYGGGGYRARSITYSISDNYTSANMGIGIFKTIQRNFELYAEPFFNYQLNKNSAIDVRNRFWFGLKAGINYSFKKYKK